MSLNPSANSDSRTLVPPTEDTGNTDDQPPAFTCLNHYLHPPLEPLDFRLPTSSTRPSSLQSAETENSFFLRHPPQYPLPTFDEIAAHIVPPTESPAMPEVVPADDLDAESQDDNALTYGEMLDRVRRTRYDPMMSTERRVLKVPRVRKHQSSSARRERKIRSRSRPSDMDLLDGREETYSRKQHIPTQERPQEEPGSSRCDNPSGPPVNLPEVQIECTGEGRPATPPKVGVDMGRMDWCQQTPPHQTYLEECLMDWSKNSPPAPPVPPAPPTAAAATPPPPSQSIY
ncbi:hypothetical protein B9Z19DRAFT_1061232 [Tuber borchii]|uniref:Uncharacterized protein n=1 Tax=Tuber borchii TaxID=42251 RepID=A0A2T7A5Q4_TUBBO|nr:hypothetical protein B9Z19DRAFT_1061232 [Tuber borchii]